MLVNGINLNREIDRPLYLQVADQLRMQIENGDLAPETRLPASRVLANSPGSQGCIGLGTGLTHSLTLGCGTWGSTSTTDNVSFGHLLNIKRIAQAL